MFSSISCLTWLFLVFGTAHVSDAFAFRQVSQNHESRASPSPKVVLKSSPNDAADKSGTATRRSVLTSAAVSCGSLLLPGLVNLETANAAVGTLPEFADTNAMIQGITINVADKSQQDAMINFLTDGFDFQVLRKRIKDSVEDTWLGFGPEQLSIPNDFELPVSSFALYGGHASVHIRYDSRAAAPLYRQGDDVPGDNIAFLQVGVPGYRISQMVANGGKIIDAFGLIDVISPSGLQMRGIVGIAPDPIMFVAINCANVQQSKSFYEQLGFVEQEYPFSRPSKGLTPFEPAQPRNSVYMSPSPNCMGVLLLQAKKKKVTINPVFQSLNIVYTPSEGTTGEQSTINDLSGIPIRFQPDKDFQLEEQFTR